MNVMYIDDDAGNRAVLNDMLGLGRVRMAEAADTRTGLAMLDRDEFNLILMDLRMPEVNGLTAIRMVRARGDARGKVPIVVVTADLTPGVEQMCRHAGADGFLAKPVTIARLFGTIGAVMAGRDPTLA